MTVTAKISGATATAGDSTSLGRHALALYEKPRPVMAVAELVPLDRTEPVDPAGKSTVRLGIGGLWVAPAGSQEGVLRDVAAALHLAETADGTLDEGDQLQLAEQTMELAAGMVNGEQVASLTAILDWTLGRVEAIAGDEKLRPVDVRKALGQVADRAAAARLGVQGEGGPAW